MSKGRPFETGNKYGQGRPPGSKNKKTLLAQQMLDDHAEPLMRKAVLLALQGDAAMLRMLVGYILARHHEQPPKTGPLRIGTPEELVQSSASIIQGVSAGKITMHDARELFRMLDSRRKIIETAEFDTRIRAIETQRSGHIKALRR